MNYLKSEHLKFKRTAVNRLVFLTPLLTAVFAWVVGGFTGFQYTAFYWWYAFLLPGYDRDPMHFVTAERGTCRKILRCIFHARRPLEI